MMFFIPARKGSKRIPNKNMAIIAGKPLIQWTFESVASAISKRKVSCDRVFVSSDDDNILKLAKRFNFGFSRRPDILCGDKVKMTDVILFHISSFEFNSDVCVLYPTNPLRSDKQIINAIDKYSALAYQPFHSTLMSVTPVDHRPYGLMKTGDSGYLECQHSYGELFYQSQGMPSLYRANGAIFIIPTRMIEQQLINSQLFCKKTIPFVMDRVSGYEIDEPEDIKVAETFLYDRHKNLRPCHDDIYVSTTMNSHIVNRGVMEYVNV